MDNDYGQIIPFTAPKPLTSNKPIYMLMVWYWCILSKMVTKMAHQQPESQIVKFAIRHLCYAQMINTVTLE